MDTNEVISIDIESIAGHIKGFLRLKKQGLISADQLRAIRFAISELVGEDVFNKAMTMVKTI